MVESDPIVISSSDSEEETAPAPVRSVVKRPRSRIQLYSLVKYPPFGDAWVVGQLRPGVYKLRLPWGNAYVQEKNLIEPSQAVLFQYPKNERGAITLTKSDLLRLQPGMYVGKSQIVQVTTPFSYTGI